MKSLKEFIDETYSSGQSYYLQRQSKHYIQIDDQDDYDNVSDYVNIFLTVLRRNNFELEIIGKLPITQDMADLVEIYHGKVNLNSNRIVIRLHCKQIEVLQDLSALIKKTALMGDLVGNLHWQQYSARIVSSLTRFIRAIKEFIAIRQKQFV